MKTERNRIAEELRAEGRNQPKRLELTLISKERILANATRESERILGDGDATTATYAEAFNADPEFYDFTRSLAEGI